LKLGNLRTNRIQNAKNNATPFMFFESYRWCLYETRQASRVEEQTVAGLRKPRGGRCRVRQARDDRTPTVMSPEGRETSQEVRVSAGRRSFGRVPHRRRLTQSSRLRGSPTKLNGSEASLCGVAQGYGRCAGTCPGAGRRIKHLKVQYSLRVQGRRGRVEPMRP
jgi:hypothetical protein